MGTSATLPLTATEVVVRSREAMCRSATTAFVLLCAGHLLLWTLVPALMYQTVPRDTLEGIVWGRQWLFGYEKHPFLAPWISAALTDTFGIVGWPVFLASQLAIATCFWAVWHLARSLLDPWRAFVAVAALEGINYYNVCSFNFNPNFAMLATWPLLTLAVHQAVTRPALWRWMLAGLCGGLALLAKYESLLLFLTLLIPLILTSQGRQCLRTPGPYLAILTGLLVASPNLVWLAQHDFVALRYVGDTYGPVADTAAVSTSRLQSLEFLASQLAALIPAALLLLVFRLRPTRPSLQDFSSVFVLSAGVGPLLLAVLFGLLTGSQLRVHWAVPFFSFSTLAAILVFRPVIRTRALRRFGLALSALSLLMVVGLYAIIYVRPAYTGKPPFSIMFPAHTLATHVTAQWHRRYESPLAWVAGERYLVAGVSAYSPDRPKPFFDFDPKNNPWWDESAMLGRGFAIVVRLADATEMPVALERLKARYPAIAASEHVALPQLSETPLPLEHFLVAYLAPQAGAK